MKQLAVIAFGLLLAIGLFLILQGVVGPDVEGAAFAEAFAEEFELPKDPGTYRRLRIYFAQTQERKAVMVSILGLSIAGIAAFGLWTTHRDRP